MAETFRLVRVFLASPGDLPNERRLIKETEEELNSGIAFHFGFRVEVKGWEDTLSGSGRPQAIINQELDTCELFIGMMSRKWGTPPSTDGPYTSGFEEEFERSLLRNKNTGKPEMAMYFKEIDPKFLVDKGDDLKKVLAFKDRISANRVILYETFVDPYDLQKRVRLKIQKYLMDLLASEEESQEEEQGKTKNLPEAVDGSQKNEHIESPFSDEGHDFLKSFLEKTENENSTENITPLEVARFRLLSSSISKPGNDEPLFGVHDANIIYSNKQIKYGARETLGLINCALKNISHENTPLWNWYKEYSGIVGEDFLPFKSLSDGEIGSASLEAMRFIGSTIPIKEDYYDREFFVSDWLSDESSESKKLSALRYLRRYGKNEDLRLIQSEYDRADSKTSRLALEAIINIKLRYNKSEAMKIVFTSQYDSIDEALLQEVFSAPTKLNYETKKLGLKHRNKAVRLEAFRRLSVEGKISDDELHDLKNDPFYQIRKEVVTYLLKNKYILKDEDVNAILVKPKKRGGLVSMLSPDQSDEEGKVCYEDYLFSKYFRMPEKQLLKIVEDATVFDDIPYFSLCSRYFKNHSEELRESVDDRFSKKYESYIENLEKLGATEETIGKFRNVEDFVRKQLTRKALDILCQKGGVKDLSRIRENMRSGYVKSSVDEIDYMRQHGEWEDIPFLLKAEKDHLYSRTSLSVFSVDSDWNRSVAKSVYQIGKDRLDELLGMDIPSQILVELIKTCSFSKFSELPDNTLLKYLYSKIDKVRKFIALKSIQSFKKSKIESLLKVYMDGQDYRYYNVIYWFDFGISLPRSTTKKAIDAILEN